ncbi:MAG: DUF5678 domain-containing protein [Candidatus Peribacteraceae bacterium]|nr:DUF5678 domain-containing protein [Candidatus Peribacteraceae bacterium]
MKFKAEHAGKWIVAKDGKIVAVDKTLTRVKKQVVSRGDFSELRFALVPRGHIAG